MILDRKSLAPALDAGLDIMESLAERKAIGFNELCASLPMSKASVSRVLKTLAERGYVRKDLGSGKWLPGPRMGIAGFELPVQEMLKAEAPAVLKSFFDRTGNTALCAAWNGEEFNVVAKEQREGGIVMIDVGTVTRDLSTYPWGWLFYFSLDKASRAKALRNFKERALFESHAQEWARHIEGNGFAFDDHRIYPNRMRFAAPVYDGSGKLAGAVGSTATRLSLPPEGFDFFVGELLKAASALSSKLGFNKRMDSEVSK